MTIRTLTWIASLTKVKLLQNHKYLTEKNIRKKHSGKIDSKSKKKIYNLSRQKKGNFDWYIDWKQLGPHFDEAQIPLGSKILNVGCGDSSKFFEQKITLS